MILRTLVASIVGFSALMLSSLALADLFVTTFSAQSVAKYDEASGTGGIFIPGDGSEKFGLAIGPDRNLYVAGPNGVTRHDAMTGALLMTFEPAPPSTGSDFRILTSAAFGPDGRLYVADLWNGEVLRYDSATGSFVDVFLSSASLGREPHGLAFTPDGTSLMVSSDLLNRIRRYDATTGVFEGFFTPDDGLFAGTQIAFGPDGNLYVPGFLEHNVRRYDGNTGAFIDTFASGSGLTNPFGLVFGSDGNLYVSSGGDDRIYVFDAATGGFLRSFATDFDLSSLTYLAFSSPVPEPRSEVLWLFAMAAVAMRLRPRRL